MSSLTSGGAKRPKSAVLVQPEAASATNRTVSGGVISRTKRARDYIIATFF